MGCLCRFSCRTDCSSPALGVGAGLGRMTEWLCTSGVPLSAALLMVVQKCILGAGIETAMRNGAGSRWLEPPMICATS